MNLKQQLAEVINAAHLRWVEYYGKEEVGACGRSEVRIYAGRKRSVITKLEEELGLELRKGKDDLCGTYYKIDHYLIPYASNIYRTQGVDYHTALNKAMIDPVVSFLLDKGLRAREDYYIREVSELD